MISAPWVEFLQGSPLLDVAKACGLEVQAGRGTSPGSFACPACGVRNRHAKSKDKRLSVGVAPGGGARCFECGQGLGAFAVVSYAIGGAAWADLPDHKRDEVREWGKRYAGIVEGAPQSPTRPATPAPIRPPAVYPDASDVAALVASCHRADDQPDVAEWLASRALHPGYVADAHLGYALGAGAVLPPWARRWPASGHRFVVPLYDAHGALRSVLARLVRPPREGERKSLAPADLARAGLCVMDARAREGFASETGLPAWWDVRARPQFVLCEGEMNAIAHATTAVGDDRYGPITIGVFSGGWTHDHTRRLPRGADVVVALDHDAGGETLEGPIMRSLAMRPDLGVYRG